MKYMGSKNRHAKDILPIIVAARKSSQYYVEPFVGGFNMIDKVNGPRIANDNHRYLIALFKELQNYWVPPDSVCEEEYLAIKRDKDQYPDHLVGFIGFCCSYSGKWFGGYARGNDAKGYPRNYCLESKKNLLKQVPKIKGIDIRCGSYLDLKIPANSLVYCDPPYQNTTKYNGTSKDFNSGEFWEWARQLHNQGHTVFVSEYNAPIDFRCVWEKKVNNTLVKNTGSKQGVERLFTL